MPTVPLREVLQHAIQRQRAGHLAEAESICGQILQQHPGHGDALHLLGILAHQNGRSDEAAALIEQAIAADPAVAEYHNTLGVVRAAQGRFDAAGQSFRRALQIRPGYPEAHTNLGNALRNQGQLDSAAMAYREAIRCKPDHLPARNALAELGNNIGVALIERGQFDQAADELRAALRLKPDAAQIHNNLGNALRLGGHAQESLAAYRHALRLQPDVAEFHNNLGLALRALGRGDEAIQAYRNSIGLNPNLAGVQCNFGIALAQQGDRNGAIGAFREALRCNPNLAEAHSNLGVALMGAKRLDEALVAAQNAVRLAPDCAQWHYHLAKVLMQVGRGDAAIAEFRAAIACRPDFADAHNDLGCALRDRGEMDQAVAQLRQAITLRPDYAPAHSNLGNLLKDRGELDAALAAYRQAMCIDPQWITSYQNLLYALNFHPQYDGATILREHQAFDRLHAQPLAKPPPAHGNDRDPDRRLRVGYVSPDFRDHVVGRNILPLLGAHDHARFEIACYALMQHHDAMTVRFQALTDIWRDAADLGDDEIAQMIRDDRIDILVDLALHMDGNRLLVFARKPAPVQVTFAGYPGTTGLEAIDYRLTDPYLDPPGMNDAFYSEESIRLPDCFWCYDARQSDVPINELPALSRARVTFGCLNNFCKVNDAVLKAWSAVLMACPDSRMVILAGAGDHRRQVLAALGVDPTRVEFIGHRSRADYLKLYHGLDLILDTFPYNGHSTTCDALWMGVPVVSLAGKTAVGRGGLSVLSNIGLPELVADSEEMYVRIATELAHDLSRLSRLRSTLRLRMEKSPLLDAPGFARNIEAAYRRMWLRWCAQ